MNYGTIMEPDGPMIAIYKGWFQSENEQKLNSERLPSGDSQGRSEVGAAKQRGRKTGAQRQFEFVNATTPQRMRDTDMQRLVRTHVRNNYLREKKPKSPRLSPPSLPSTVQQSFQRQPITDETLTSDSKRHGQIDIFDVPTSLGIPTAYTAGYGIEMQPRMYALLARYLTYMGQRMYPGKSRQLSYPLQSPEWFRFAVTDDAMLHGYLYSAAVCLGLLEDRTEFEDTIYHLHQTISIVNRRLKSSPHSIEDSTVAALSCVALGAAITGNSEAWNIHMKGMKYILQTTNRLSPLNELFIAKLRRTDVAGAIDYSLTPHLEFTRPIRPSIWSNLPERDLRTTKRDACRVLSSCQVHSSLVDIMVDVACFSQALLLWRAEPSTSMDFKALTEDMYGIEYRLLLFPTTSLGGMEERPIDKACRTGALLYMKALLDEFPHSVTGQSILLKQLLESLRDITVLDVNSPLLLWLSLIGAALSKSESRVRFMDLLTQLSTNFRLSSFRDQELEMSRVMGLEEVLGRSLEQRWTEVKETLRTRAILLQL